MLQWLKAWHDFPHPFSTRLLTRACIWGARVETQLRLPKTVPYHVWMLYVLLYISLIFFEEKCAEAHKCVEVVEKASAKGNEGCWKNINTHWQTTMCCVSIFLTTDLVFAMIGIGRQFLLCANISKRHHKNTKQTSQTSQRHRPNFLNMSETKTKFTNISKTQNKHLEHLKLCNKGVSYVYLMIKLTFKSAVTHPKDTDLTRIVCIYNHHNQYLHVSVWNTEKRDTKQNHHIVWCCARAYETFQWKAVPILGLPERWLHPWSLRPLPVQFTRAFVILSSAPCPLAVGQVDFQNVGVCVCRPCSSADCFSDPWSLRLPPVQFTRVFAHNVMMVQYDAASFVGHTVLSGSHAGLSWDCSRCLAMLFVIHLFWCALCLIEQVMRRIQRCQWFSFANVFCGSSFCNDWCWTWISYMCFMNTVSL